MLIRPPANWTRTHAAQAKAVRRGRRIEAVAVIGHGHFDQLLPLCDLHANERAARVAGGVAERLLDQSVHRGLDLAREPGRAAVAQADPGLHVRLLPMLEEARTLSRAEFPFPERSILVAPQGEAELDALRAIAEPLARSEPPRELILARLVRPTRGASARGALQTEDKLLREASDEVTIARLELVEKGVATRGVAFSSADPGKDLVKPGRERGGGPPARRRAQAAAGGRRAARRRGHRPARGGL